MMKRKMSLATLLCGPLLPLAFGMISVSPAAAACGAGAPSTKDIQCVATMSSGSILGSFDISWVNPDRAEYYLADRSTMGVDIFSTQSVKFKRTIGGFVGVSPQGSSHSGPNGVVTYGHWLYAGDGDSTLKVADLNSPNPMLASYSTGGTTRLDEMAVTSDGRLLLAVNDAENPPFMTLFAANGNDPFNHVSIIRKITIDPSILPPNLGLGMEQPSWDPTTRRFVVAIPTIADNPSGCTPTSTNTTNTCDGGLVFVDPTSPQTVYGAFDTSTNTGVVFLHACGPNGTSIGPHDNVLLGCTPSNSVKNNTTSQVINATTRNYAMVANVTGSDEVWFNKGDHRYYTASSNNNQPSGTTNPVLGVIDGTSVLIETLPQGSKSHSVAADSARNLIFVPQQGGLNDEGAVICGNENGCVAVYKHRVPDDEHHFGNEVSELIQDFR